MATVEKVQRVGGIVYMGKVRKQGHPTTTKSFKTRNAAQRWARRTDAGIEEHRAGQIDEGQRHSFTEAADGYTAGVRPELRPATARKYQQHLLLWRETFERLRPPEVTPVSIAAARDSLTAAGKPRATVNRYLATLAAVLFGYVQRWHWLAASPMTQVH